MEYDLNLGVKTPIVLKDGRTVRIGRVRPKATYNYGPFHVVVKQDDSKVVMPRLAAFHDAGHDEAPPPAKADWWTAAMQAVKEMYKNDQLGDCCIAMLAHMIGLLTASGAGKTAVGTDSQIVTDYHQICGPGDNGCMTTDVLDAWKKGVQIGDGGTHKIEDYVAVDWTNQQLVQAAIDIFGTIAVAVSLPSDWTSTDEVWDVSRSRIVGGHCIPGGAYGAGLTNSKGSAFGAEGVSISTWAGLSLITWKAFTSKQWIEECYVPLSPDWYSNSNLAPNGVNVAGLQAAFAAIKAGQVPDVPTPPPAVLDWSKLL